MAAYNKLNSKYCSQNPWLLTRVLREEWGFNGLVMTDWGAGDNQVEQVNSGVDLIMPGSDEIVSRLIDAYNQGLICREVVDERARRVLEVIQRSLKTSGYNPSNKPNLEEHAKVAYEVVVEGAM